MPLLLDDQHVDVRVRLDVAGELRDSCGPARSGDKQPGTDGGPAAHGIAALPLAWSALGTAATGGVLVSLGWLFFLKTGALVFGSGLAIVPLLRDEVVARHHWLTQDQFLDAVAMGLINPGPGGDHRGFHRLPGRWAPGTVIATIAIFIPIWLGVVLPGRWFVRHRDNPRSRRSSLAPPPPSAPCPARWSS